MDGALFKLKHQLRTDTAFTVKMKACIHTWHRRLGHRDLAAVRKLSDEQLADGIHLAKCDGEVDCEVCIKGKLAQPPFPMSDSRAMKPTELVHSDVCGPMPTATPSGHRYMLTFIDDYSRFTFVRLLKAKDEVADVVKEYIAKVKTKFGHNPVTFRTDNGKEYVNWELQDFFQAKWNRTPVLSAIYSPAKWSSGKKEPGTSRNGKMLLDPVSNKIWISRSVRIIEEDQQYAKSIEQEVKASEGAKELTLEEIDESDDPSKHGTDVNVEDVFGSSWHESQLESGIEAPRRSQRANKGVPPQKLSYKVKTEKASEPSSWEEVLDLPPCEREKWIAAAKEELASLKNREVWELVQLPAGREVISSKWVFKLKKSADDTLGTYKARLVARGFSQRYGEDYDETFAPVVKHETIRMLLSIAAIRSLHVRHFDVKCAYLNGEIHEELYMQQPPGFEEPGNENHVLRLKRSIYGLKHTTYVLLYVDDLLVAGESEAITRNVGAQLNKHFITKDLGRVSNYLGIQIERKEDGMSEVKPKGTPMETGYLSTMNESNVPLPNNVKYRQVIGSLLYIATVSRPDIALAVGLLCRRVESPTEYDWKSAKRVLRYLAGTKELKLCLSAMSNPVLQGYVDADWAGDRTDRKSTSAYLFQFGESIISWSTKKQTTVALSSTEAEYIAMAEACKELLWLRQLLEDFGILQVNATTIFEDNQGCICLVESERFTDRTKHISVKYHLLKDLRERGIIDVKYCPSDQMMADAWTKPVSKEQLNRFARQIGLMNWQ
ncbi:hypothetical protein M514_18362 [Trichuris suis]|uniref:Integrase catalytic domain-containing protein n=1 Tax=Trichuris suis TaxID=68888 RepID=A0A085NJ44_9BILA|nr:hypothetical protein M514_18362 [Trichuris suis]